VPSEAVGTWTVANHPPHATVSVYLQQ